MDSTNGQGENTTSCGDAEEARSRQWVDRKRKGKKRLKNVQQNSSDPAARNFLQRPMDPGY